MKISDGQQMNLRFQVTAVLLILLAIVQLLWIFKMPQALRRTSDSQESSQTQNAGILKPQQVFLTLGGQDSGSYARLTFAEDSFESLYGSAFDLLQTLAPQLTFEKHEAGDLPWQRAQVILSYSYAVGRDAVNSQLGTDIDGSYNEIWIVPSLSEDQQAQICFYNSYNGACLIGTGSRGMTAQDRALAQTLLETGIDKDNRYVEMSGAFPDAFSEGMTFLPEVSQHETMLRGSAVSAFLDDEKKEDPSRMDRYAMQFFRSPATVTRQEVDQGILYSNEKISLLVDPEGRMEFVETLTDEEKESVTVDKAYRKAVSFLKEDMARSEVSRQTGVYLSVDLADYRENKDGSYTFYFNYRINGYRVRMESSKAVLWDMDYPATVTVQGQKVRSCQRLVLNVVMDTEKDYTVAENWLDAADWLSKKWTLTTPPELVYYISAGSLIPEWEADTEQGRTWFSASLQ
ncbi:MAG TPA: hypothetical protein DEP00_08190 [Lachnospiraceae bacterium]|nr:hypothetical protein [Lachnospiraceae bacterium]